VLVESIAVGVCGTDLEIVEGKYGWSPSGSDRLVLGHESLGRVLDPGHAAGLEAGDLVVGIVRRPDPVPCPNCAVGEWDMCRNGQYTERGIKQIDGFMSERWRIEPDYVMKVDHSLGLLGVLLEPATVVAKLEIDGERKIQRGREVLIADLDVFGGAGRETAGEALIDQHVPGASTVLTAWSPGPALDSALRLNHQYLRSSAAIFVDRPEVPRGRRDSTGVDRSGQSRSGRQHPVRSLCK
jgi:Alcohol dehydrogenase GroES-like domain